MALVLSNPEGRTAVEQQFPEAGLSLVDLLVLVNESLLRWVGQYSSTGVNLNDGGSTPIDVLSTKKHRVGPD